MRQGVDNGIHGRGTISVLIVDDDRELCQLLQMVFRKSDYKADVVYNGYEAIQCVEAAVPDLIILDVMMPEMNGWETFQRLRAISDVPVLFLTGLSSGENAAQALQSGTTDYMRKPYSTSELLVRVEILLARSYTRRTFTDGESTNRPLPDRPAIVAIIPAFNEERFIGSMVLKARKYTQAVLVIDDGSSDATAQLARDAGAFVISHPSNLGKGAALNTAFGLVREHNPQVVVMLDGDGQHLPEELCRVAEPVLLGKADIVVGSRYLEKKSQVPHFRIIGHRVFNWITHLASGVSVSDSQSGYRAFSPKAIEAISFYSNGFSVESEMQFIIRENNLRFVEIPITIRYDDRPKRPVVAHGLAVLNGILHLVGQYRPLLFFGLPGLLLLIFGLAWGIWVVELYSRIQQLAIGYAMISLLLSIIGLMMLSTGIILHSVRGLLITMLHSKWNPIKIMGNKGQVQ